LERIKIRVVPAAISEADGMLKLHTGELDCCLVRRHTEDTLVTLAEELASVNAPALGVRASGGGKIFLRLYPVRVEGTRGCSGR
jgi:hypothetical protein